MKKPTTVEGWLKTLPEPLRSSALSQSHCIDLLNESESLSSSILSFCIWRETKEGMEFWSSFWESLIWAESKEG
jgi:hypothetical protein